MPASKSDPFAMLLDEIQGNRSDERAGHVRLRPVGNPGFNVQFVSDPANPITAEMLGGLYVDELVYDPSTAADMPPPKTSTDPRDIAAELAITAETTTAELYRLRRGFALDNHPDRLAPHYRESATRRMMIANRMIDDAIAARNADWA